jgi:hypothetical protein
MARGEKIIRKGKRSDREDFRVFSIKEKGARQWI